MKKLSIVFLIFFLAVSVGHAQYYTTSYPVQFGAAFTQDKVVRQEVGLLGSGSRQNVLAFGLFPVDVPRNAIIEEVFVRFLTRRPFTDHNVFRVRLLDAPQATFINDYQDFEDASVDLTTQFVNWGPNYIPHDPNLPGDVPVSFRTPSFHPILQYVISHPAWQPNNRILIRFGILQSIEVVRWIVDANLIGYSPVLFVKYSIDATASEVIGQIDGQALSGLSHINDQDITGLSHFEGQPLSAASAACSAALGRTGTPPSQGSTSALYAEQFTWTGTNNCTMNTLKAYINGPHADHVATEMWVAIYDGACNTNPSRMAYVNESDFSTARYIGGTTDQEFSLVNGATYCLQMHGNGVIRYGRDDSGGNGWYDFVSYTSIPNNTRNLTLTHTRGLYINATYE